MGEDQQGVRIGVMITSWDNGGEYAFERVLAPLDLIDKPMTTLFGVYAGKVDVMLGSIVCCAVIC